MHSLSFSFRCCASSGRYCVSPTGEAVRYRLCTRALFPFRCCASSGRCCVIPTGEAVHYRLCTPVLNSIVGAAIGRPPAERREIKRRLPVSQVGISQKQLFEALNRIAPPARSGRAMLAPTPHDSLLNGNLGNDKVMNTTAGYNRTY